MTRPEGILQHGDRVHDATVERVPPAHRLPGEPVQVKLFPAELRDGPVDPGEGECKAVGQVARPATGRPMRNAAPGRLIGIRRADPTLGRADLRAAPGRLLQPVKHPVIGHDDMGAIRDPEVVQPDAPQPRARSFHQAAMAGGWTVPEPMIQTVAGLKMPEGTRCKRNVPCSLTTVCPALSPPLEADHHMGILGEVIDNGVPFPSSPHCAPTTAVTAMRALLKVMQLWREYNTAEGRPRIGAADLPMAGPYP